MHSDGACLYRAISRLITGNENYFNIIKLAILQFVKLPDNHLFTSTLPQSSEGDIFNVDNFVSKRSDPSSWGTQDDIYIFCTLAQVEILVFMYSSSGNPVSRWVLFKPLFVNKTCMEISNCAIHLINYDNLHYNAVIPHLL